MTVRRSGSRSSTWIAGQVNGAFERRDRRDDAAGRRQIIRLRTDGGGRREPDRGEQQQQHTGAEGGCSCARRSLVGLPLEPDEGPAIGGPPEPRAYRHRPGGMRGRDGPDVHPDERAWARRQPRGGASMPSASPRVVSPTGVDVPVALSNVNHSASYPDGAAATPAATAALPNLQSARRGRVTDRRSDSRSSATPGRSRPAAR